MNKNKNLAFTLAEVLIVIGIIGVVAALTLPNLNHATGDKEKVTKVKKIYSNLTEAVDRAQAIYGDFATWGNGLSSVTEMRERLGKRITEFMKVSKDCGFNDGCFSDAPLLDSYGVAIENNDSCMSLLDDYYMVTLSDGMSVAILGNSSDGSFRAIRIRVDIDGPNKGKNQEGVDIFDFTVNSSCDSDPKNQIIPSACMIYWTGGNLLWYETAWVIENGNLDYLKCPDELNWETKTSCE